MDNPLIICICVLGALSLCCLGKCLYYNTQHTREVHIRQTAFNLKLKRSNKILNIDEEIKEEPTSICDKEQVIRHSENV